MPFVSRTAPRPPCPATVRAGIPADLAAAAALIIAVATGEPEFWRARFERDVARGGLLVAELADEVVGYVRVAEIPDADPPGRYLVGLVVAEPARRRGVAEALLAAVPDPVHSFYDVDNHASAALHTRCGFTPVGQPVAVPGAQTDRDVLVRRP